MLTNTRISARFAIVLTIATTLLTTVGTTCATEPKPRPTALDPSNPAAPESPALVAAAGATTSAAAVTSTATTYTCPMHPEVVSDKPGRCPKCGMKLVAKKPATDDKK